MNKVLEFCGLNTLSYKVFYDEELDHAYLLSGDKLKKYKSNNPLCEIVDDMLDSEFNEIVFIDNDLRWAIIDELRNRNETIALEQFEHSLKWLD